MKKHIISLFCAIALLLLSLSACGSKDTIEGHWVATSTKNGYPQNIIIMEDGTGMYDGGNSFTWTCPDGMTFIMYTESKILEFCFSVDGNDLNLVSIDEPEWTSDYGVDYTRN